MKSGGAVGGLSWCQALGNEMMGYGMFRLVLCPFVVVVELLSRHARARFHQSIYLFKQFTVACNFTYNTVSKQCWCNNR